MVEEDVEVPVAVVLVLVDDIVVLVDVLLVTSGVAGSKRIALSASVVVVDVLVPVLVVVLVLVVVVEVLVKTTSPTA